MVDIEFQMGFWEYPAAFFAMFFTDVFNAYYIQAIQQSKALKASILSKLHNDYNNDLENARNIIAKL